MISGTHSINQGSSRARKYSVGRSSIGFRRIMSKNSLIQKVMLEPDSDLFSGLPQSLSKNSEGPSQFSSK